MMGDVKSRLAQACGDGVDFDGGWPDLFGDALDRIRELEQRAEKAEAERDRYLSAVRGAFRYAANSSWRS